MNPAKNGLYFREWALTKRALMPGRSTWTKYEEEQRRHRVHFIALGYDKSHTLFSDSEFDRVLRKMRELRDPDNLNAVIDFLALFNHDVAQVNHVPIVAPGKARRKDDPPRTRPSHYECMTPVDDPGERRRRIYVISRLFRPSLIDKICFDRWQVRNYEELGLPQLTELRDLLKSRLSKFITQVKKKSATEGRRYIWRVFGFSIFNADTGRDFSNADVIEILLRRVRPIDLRLADEVEESKTVEAPF